MLTPSVWKTFIRFVFRERERVFRVREIGFFNLREFPVWSYNIYVASGSFQTELNGPFTCYLDRGKGGV